MLIGLTLFIMAMVSFLNIIMGATWGSITLDAYVNNNVLVNGTTTNFQGGYGSFVFGIDSVTGMISAIWFIGAIAIGVGIHVLGSGLGETAQRYFTLGVIYLGIWGALTTLTWNLIIAIQIFGAIIYILLTVGYAVGCISKIAGGDTF
ncbi:MAG: hypothetical protein ACFFDH_09520 [Promethearchaeota archaeon]